MAKTSNCAEVANSLVDCIKKTSCYQSSGSIRSCIKDMKDSDKFGDGEVELKCQVLRGAYFECKRSQLDMRKRIRGKSVV